METYGICVESSHEKGMGHLFRMLNLVDFLKSKGDRCAVFINDDKKSKSILKNAKVNFEMVKLNDFDSDWESKLITKYKVDVWINDRLDTNIKHSCLVKKNDILLVTFDDRGSGARKADINIGGLPFNYNYTLEGKKILKGLKYLILNKGIDKFKRVRRSVRRIIVILSGSDTHLVTIKVIKILKLLNLKATIAIGPCFRGLRQLRKISGRGYPIINNIGKSLMKELYKYDLAITGAGITPFEANASGLPCIMIANEQHEVKNALFLKKLGSSVFAGHHSNIKEEVFLSKLNIEKMSKIGLKNITTKAIDRIYRQINSL